MNKIEVRNIDGQIVYHQLFENETGNVVLNLSNITNGVYIIQLYTEEGIATKKFIMTK